MPLLAKPRKPRLSEKVLVSLIAFCIFVCVMFLIVLQFYDVDSAADRHTDTETTVPLSQ